MTTNEQPLDNSQHDAKLPVISSEHLPLLQSLKGGRKYLDMGKSPVGAIQMAWQWQDLGVVEIGSDSYITLTQLGLDVLSAHGL